MIVNQAPWMTALEMQLHALALSEFLIANDKTSELHSGWQVDRALLRAATPFHWSTEAIDAVLAASKTIPLDTKMNKWNLNSPTAWWFFEKPLPFKTVTAECGVNALNFGWLPTKTDLGMPCCAWLLHSMSQNNPDEQYNELVRRFPMSPSQTWEWEIDMTLEQLLNTTRTQHRKLYGPGGRWRDKPIIGEDVFMHTTEGISRFLLAGLAWLEQRVILSDPGHVERHRRKAFMRSTGQREVPTLRVIQLRKAEPTQHERSENTSDAHAFNCRWVVGGHWRNQPCGPKHGDRRLTYIHPYLKGPDDKPLRTPAKTIYVVNR